jgi:hypothetical protein
MSPAAGAISLLALVMAAGGLALPTAAAEAPGAAAVPPDLQALVERSQHLQVPYLITTERLGFEGNLPGPLRRGEPAAAVSVEEQSRALPEQAQVSGTVFGSPYRARYIGGELYWKPLPDLVDAVSGVRSRLRGRHWIKLTRRDIARKATARLPAPINPAAPNPLDSVGLAPLVAIERNIVEVGPATVDGTPVTSFRGTVNRTQLASVVHDNFTGLEPPSDVSVVLDIAPNGLLKRITLSGASARVTTRMVGDVLSTTTPVSVRRPPARDTANAGELTRGQLRGLNL